MHLLAVIERDNDKIPVQNRLIDREASDLCAQAIDPSTIAFTAINFNQLSWPLSRFSGVFRSRDP